MHSILYLGLSYFKQCIYGANLLKDVTFNHKVSHFFSTRKLQIQLFNILSGLFTVPTRVVLAIAPINALLNYLLGTFLV